MENHGETLERLCVDANNGVADLLKRLSGLTEDERLSIEATVAH